MGQVIELAEFVRAKREAFTGTPDYLHNGREFILGENTYKGGLANRWHVVSDDGESTLCEKYRIVDITIKKVLVSTVLPRPICRKCASLYLKYILSKKKV